MRRKKEKMYALVKTWQSGNESKAGFCQEHQINIHTFTYWVQKYKTSEEGQKAKSTSEKFIALRVKAPEVLEPSTIELCYPNGLRLRMEGQPNISYLESLIRIKV